MPFTGGDCPLKARFKSCSRVLSRKCSKCTRIASAIINNLPLIVLIPHNFLDVNDKIPTMIMLKEIAYVLLLIAAYERSKKHFISIFRLSNDFLGRI